MDQRPALAEARHRLFEARAWRLHPSRDDVQLVRLRQLPSNAAGIAKVLTAWNGLMLAAFAEAARILERDDYHQVAERYAEFLLREPPQENGRLLRPWKAGDAKLKGCLEDYAYLIEGLLGLYQATFDPRRFVAAEELAETMLAHFQAPEGVQLACTRQLPSNSSGGATGIAGFFDTSEDHEALITRMEG